MPESAVVVSSARAMVILEKDLTSSPVSGPLNPAFESQVAIAVTVQRIVKAVVLLAPCVHHGFGLSVRSSGLMAAAIR